MALDQEDIKEFERLIYRNADDIAISVCSSLESLQKRIDVADARICSRLADIEDRLESRSTGDRDPSDQ